MRLDRRRAAANLAAFQRALRRTNLFTNCPRQRCFFSRSRDRSKLLYANQQPNNLRTFGSLLIFSLQLERDRERMVRARVGGQTAGTQRNFLIKLRVSIKAAERIKTIISSLVPPSARSLAAWLALCVCVCVWLSGGTKTGERWRQQTVFSCLERRLTCAPDLALPLAALRPGRGHTFWVVYMRYLVELMLPKRYDVMNGVLSC